MGIFTPNKEQLLEAAGIRFRAMLENHDTAVIFSRYVKLMERMNDETEDGSRGLIFATEYELLDELYTAVFAADLKHAKRLAGGKTSELLALFQEVMRAPLVSAPSEPTSGPENPRD